MQYVRNHSLTLPHEVTPRRHHLLDKVKTVCSLKCNLVQNLDEVLHHVVHCRLCLFLEQIVLVER